MQTASLIISIASACIACIALGWNIYRDVFMTPSLIVRAAFACTVTDPRLGGFYLKTNRSKFPGPEPFVVITAVNRGPGVLRLHAMRAVGPGSRERFLIPIPPPHFTEYDRLPKNLAPGEEAYYTLPIDQELLGRNGASRIGLRDQYARMHWVPYRDMRCIRKVVSRTNTYRSTESDPQT